MYSCLVKYPCSRLSLSLFKTADQLPYSLVVAICLVFSIQKLKAQEENIKQPDNIEKINPPVTIPESTESLNLLNGQENPLKYWKFYSADQLVKQEETFYISTNGDPKEPILVCKGKPFGYLRYHEECVNYDFSFEWKYAKDPHGNSGVLLHVHGEDKIWPKGMQIQLHRPTAGSIFPSGGAKSDNVLKIVDPPVKEAEWNTCEINSLEGKISVIINGKKQGEVTGCNPPTGSIALQSEGAEIHFRKLKLRKLKSPPEVQIPAQPVINKPVEPANKETNISIYHKKSSEQSSRHDLSTNQNFKFKVDSPAINSCQSLKARRDFRHAGLSKLDRKEVR